jgi:hypothetical protein
LVLKCKIFAHVAEARVEIGRAFIIENPGKRCAGSHQRDFAKLATALRGEQFKNTLLAAFGRNIAGYQEFAPGLFYHGIMLGLIGHQFCSLNGNGREGKS